MNFRSDNVTGIAPEILAAIAAVNAGPAPSYGEDEITGRLGRRVAELFEHEVAVFPVATGTAANALALATLTPPWGAIYCHEAAHIQSDECGAPEFFAAGAKLLPLAGEDAKLMPATVEAALLERGVVHHVQPSALSISQATEAGTLYRPAEIAALGALARRRGLALHMDGARFANAVAALGCTPAELSWRSGVDVLSLGATKNGALAAEAVVFFDPARAADFAFRRKRGGHLFSKMRFLSVQLDAYLADGLWLRHAAHANRLASRLSAGLTALPDARLRHPTEANEVFVELPERVIDAFSRAGFGFYRWGGGVSNCLRFVTAFDTRESDVERLIAVARAT